MTFTAATFSPKCFLRLVVRLRGANQGAAAVEFAIVAPILVLFLTGAVSFGLAIRMETEVGNAARAGADYAALHGYSQTGIASAAQNATALSNVTVASSEAAASCTNPSTGAIASAGSATTCPATGSAPGTYVTVTAQMPYTLILPPPGVAASRTLSATSVVRIQ